MLRHLIELSCCVLRAYLLSGHDVVGPYDGVQYLLQFHAAHGQVGRLGNALNTHTHTERKTNLD